MKSKITLLVASMLLVLSCSTKKPFHEVKVNNPEFIPDTAFVGYEDLSSPKFEALKEKYQLDTIFHGEKDELKRILLLRDWIKKHITIDNAGPYPGDGSPESILDEALKGHGFHCGHYMAVQNAVTNAYGYVTRCLGAGEGAPNELEVHHGINEIWLNTYHKWFLSDAKYNYHFEKNGIPLSALEVRDEYFKNKAADITLMKGPDRVPTEIYPELNNRHWVYNTKYLHLVPDRKAIEWMPNTITSKVAIEGSKAGIKLSSITPNLKSYQIKEMPDGNWKDVSNFLEIELKKNKNEIVFRVVNLAGVTGPEHKVIVER